MKVNQMDEDSEGIKSLDEPCFLKRVGEKRISLQFSGETWRKRNECPTAGQ